jgi:predicted glycoside hydrolase/deacetylase ChbG (UPF0249 family)
MLIINADDWGRSRKETEVALDCYRAGRITSVTAMVFMEDSLRAAEVARAEGMAVGLHLNLNQTFTGVGVPQPIAKDHQKLVRFMGRGKYAQVFYNPFLKKVFCRSFAAQLDEFRRIYAQEPTHIDGHQHRHLCTNMLWDGIIPAGRKVRRTFSFWPGEKGRVNRVYRRLVDRRLARRYQVADFFFSLGQCLRFGRLERVAELAVNSNVELMTHPIVKSEYDYLLSEGFSNTFASDRKGSYQSL